MLIFSTTITLPVYYRLLPGNIRDVKAFKLSLKESGIDHAILVADKGFYSELNIEHLDSNGLNYILPLRRNNKLLDYTPLEQLAKRGMHGYFKYNNRYIWYAISDYKNKLVIIFLDDFLRSNEEQDYLGRIDTHPEDFTLEQYHNKNISFGTLAMITNLKNKTPEQIYTIYKTRASVEEMADAFKNILEVDKSYMRNEQSLEGWMFINYIALFWYYRIYSLLMEHRLLSKITPQDLLIHLNEIKKIRINDKWYLAEITSATQKILEKIKLHIT